MRSLAATLSDVPHALRVEGHTDDVPIRTAMFASNWELSTARATRVVQFLIEDGGHRARPPVGRRLRPVPAAAPQ